MIFIMRMIIIIFVRIKTFTDLLQLFGPDQQRFCAVCRKEIAVDFVYPLIENDAVPMLKITAMLEDWRLYTQACCITLNDREVFSGELFSGKCFRRLAIHIFPTAE